MRPTSELAELSEAALKVSGLTERLNAYIDDFDEELQKMNLGVTVWLEEPMPCGWLLGYARAEDVWCVCVKRAEPDQGQAIRLTNASRAARMDSIARFGELAAALTRRLNDFAADLNACLAGASR